jgi:hypothetical protein
MKYDYEPLIQDYDNYKYPSAFEDFKNGSLELEHNLMFDNLAYPDQYNDFIDEQIDALSVIFLNDYNLLIEKEVYFFGCPFDIYKKTYSDRLNSFLDEYPDAHEIDFCDYELKKNIGYSISQLLSDKIWFSNKKKLEFLNDKVAQFAIQPLQNQSKINKSLLFEGKDLNLSERYKIANKVLNVDKVIRKLNIKDLEKYQLLAYILGCDKDNARNIMNGTYSSKDRDLSKYFNDLGLNE